MLIIAWGFYLVFFSTYDSMAKLFVFTILETEWQFFSFILTLTKFFLFAKMDHFKINLSKKNL